MNNDLISRSELKKALHNFFDGKVINEPTYILRDVFCYIDNAPTVEPEPYVIDNCDMNVFEPEKYLKERPQDESISLEDGLKKARRGKYVIYDVDFLLDNLAREVNIMESARRLKAGKGNDNE